MKYYIRITDEEPLPEEESLWFALDTQGTTDGELYVLRKNNYNQLVTTFNNIENHFEEEYVLPIVEEKLTEKLNDESFRVVNSQNTTNITDINNPSRKYTYSDLSNNLSKKADKTTMENSISSLRSDLDSLEDVKADVGHTHNGWVEKGFGQYGKFYYNESLSMCFLWYYRTDYNFTNSSDKLLWTIGESKYQPKHNTVLSAYNPNLGAIITTDGKFSVNSMKTGTVHINVTGFWICKNE